ncbi:MAG: hypothetical protein FE835_18635 [Gammaproteobacteria bacterium]|nr:hypothetical protein [Gammaproteobacteria bacterium]
MKSDAKKLLDLLGKKGLSKKQKVYQHMDAIFEGIEAGYPVKTIHGLMKEVFDVDITYPIFLIYVRREQEWRGGRAADKNSEKSVMAYPERGNNGSRMDSNPGYHGQNDIETNEEETLQGYRERILGDKR